MSGLAGVSALTLAGGGSLVLATGRSLAQDAAPDSAGDAVTYRPYTLGDPDAPVKILEFSSFTCGHCASFHTDTLPLLKEQYIDTGKANLTLVDFPLDDVALAVTLITRCAPEPLYHKLVEIYFADQDAWLKRNPLEPILGIARLGGLSEAQLDACLTDEALFEEIQRRRAEAEARFNITGTPTFAINGVRHPGSYKADSLLPAVAEALAKAEGN
nr:thioredoxin domain-containing protein [Roseospira visakhapatnamensis]